MLSLKEADYETDTFHSRSIESKMSSLIGFFPPSYFSVLLYLKRHCPVYRKALEHVWVFSSKNFEQLHYSLDTNIKMR